jgi:hypothetical protein
MPPSTSNTTGERRRQRDQTVPGLRHGRLVIENLVERAERKDEHIATAVLFPNFWSFPFNSGWSRNSRQNTFCESLPRRSEP